MSKNCNKYLLACVELVHTFVLLCTKHSAHRLQNAHHKRSHKQEREKRDKEGFAATCELVVLMSFIRTRPLVSNFLFQYPGKCNPLIYKVRKVVPTIDDNRMLIEMNVETKNHYYNSYGEPWTQLCYS